MLKQSNCLQDAREEERLRKEQLRRQQDYQIVLEELAQTTTSGQPTDYDSLQEAVTNYSLEREKRVANFLAHIRKEEEKYLETLLGTHRQLSPVDESLFIRV